MTGTKKKINLKQLARYLFPLMLTVFLFAQSRLGAALPMQSTPEPPQYTQPPGGDSVSCGKLVFLEDLKTAAKLIGLRDCGGGNVYIFGQRPAELFNNYEFYGVKIDKGSEINDAKYGRLNRYIVSFINYRQIPDCSYCGKAFEPPTATFPVPPTQEPATAAPVVSVDTPVLATEVVQVQPQQSIVVSTECISQTAQIVGQAMGFNKFQFLVDKAPEMLAQAPGAEVCGDDAQCLKTVQLKTLMGGMVETSFEVSPGVREVGQVMGGIARLLDDTKVETACTFQGAMAWEMAKQFSIKGTAIDAFAMHSPADFRVRDFENKEDGFLKTGEVKQEIPNSVARKKGDSEYVFLPGKVVKEVEIEGTSDGAMTFEALRNTEGVVQDMGYDQVPVDAQTRGHLNITAGARPKLEITASGSGQLASMDPTRYEEFKIVASVVPVTATPTVTETPTLTPTPAGFQLPGNTQLWVGLILVAGVVALLALLGIGLVYMLYMRGRKR